MTHRLSYFKLRTRSIVILLAGEDEWGENQGGLKDDLGIREEGMEEG